MTPKYINYDVIILSELKNNRSEMFSKWAQILYGVQLRLLEPVYKFWEFYEIIWPKILFWYESDLLQQVLIPTLITIANNFQMSSNFIWRAIRNPRPSI